jgi:uncharacterized integral membrane protein
MTTPGQPAGGYGYVKPVPGQVPPPVAPGQIPPPVAPTGPGQPGQGPVQGGPGRPARRGRPGGGVSWVVYAATVVVLVLAILMVLFVVKNDQKVSIWLFGSHQYMSLAGALSLAALTGLVVGLLIGLITQIPVRRRLRAAKRRIEG